MEVASRIVVISDLHLGGTYADPGKGKLGFRMCTETAKLARFIGELAQTRGLNLELVINGDFLDFLAEEWDGDAPWAAFVADAERARERLLVMMERDSAVFAALRELLTAGHAVTLLVGNHDLELSLPPVRQALEQRVNPAGGRFKYIYDGEAYSVGPVLIEHGNRYDSWNVVDHDALRRTRSTLSRGEALREELRFEPPAGSRMVATVMNNIKRRYPFVDLLKPEKEATLLMLMALAPEYRRHLFEIAGFELSTRRHGLDSAGQPAFAGDIASAPGGRASAIADLVSAAAGEAAIMPFMESIGVTARRATLEEEGDIAIASMAQLSALAPLTLGPSNARLEDRLPALHTALLAWRNEQDFDRASETDTYMRPASRLMERGWRVVVFGHTHLAKRVVVGNSVYINTGTWANLIRFPYEILDQPRDQAIGALQQFAEKLSRGELKDEIRHIPTYACIDLAADGTLESATLEEYGRS